MSHRHANEQSGAVPSAITRPFVVESVVFLCGAVGMILELAGSRLLAPYFGNSIFVWTSLIGVLLGFMALGNFLGGRLADSHLSGRMLFWILISASAAITLIAFTEGAVLPALAKGNGLRTESVAAAIALFALPSTVLGMVAPYSIRLKLHALSDSGSTVGSLYALSTIGSIVGTFLAGFWLIAAVGTHSIILVIAAVPAVLSLLFLAPVTPRRLAAAAVALLLLASAIAFSKPSLVTLDTQYERYIVRTGTDTRNGRPVVAISPQAQGGSESTVYSDNGEPFPTPYFDYFDLGLKLAPKVERTLLIGGGAFVYPRRQLGLYPESSTDVVEIDPKLLDIARKDFFLKDDPRLRIFLEDGRTFLNRNTQKYNVVLLDAFKARGSVPYQLATREAIQLCSDALDEQGILVMNLVAAPGGPSRRFLESEYATVNEVFPNALVFQVLDAPATDIQNFEIVAAKNQSIDLTSAIQGIEPQASPRLLKDFKVPDGTLVLTDDRAPVDQLISDI